MIRHYKDTKAIRKKNTVGAIQGRSIAQSSQIRMGQKTFLSYSLHEASRGTALWPPIKRESKVTLIDPQTKKLDIAESGNKNACTFRLITEWPTFPSECLHLCAARARQNEQEKKQTKKRLRQRGEPHEIKELYPMKTIHEEFLRRFGNDAKHAIVLEVLDDLKYIIHNILS